MDTTQDYYQAVKKPQHVEVREATPADDMLIRNTDGLKLHDRLGVFAYGDVYQHYYILRSSADPEGPEWPLFKESFSAAYEWVEE